MFSRSYRARFLVIFVVLIAVAAFLETAAAQKASVPRIQDRLAIGEEHVKQLLLIMEADSNGVVSKQEYMKFMEAEFERLDKGSKGQLNARQLNQSTLSASRSVGK
jgi:hypothetical protein